MNSFNVISALSKEDFEEGDLSNNKNTYFLPGLGSRWEGEVGNPQANPAGCQVLVTTDVLSGRNQKGKNKCKAKFKKKCMVSHSGAQ